MEVEPARVELEAVVQLGLVMTVEVKVPHDHKLVQKIDKQNIFHQCQKTSEKNFMLTIVDIYIPMDSTGKMSSSVSTQHPPKFKSLFSEATSPSPVT